SQAGNLVDLLLNRDAGLQILELDRATDFGKDREGERIPFGEDLADVDRLAFVNTQARAVNDVVALLFAVLFVHDGNQARPVHGDEGVVAAMNGLEVEEANETVAASFNFRLLGHAGRRPADVERAHGELRAWLADGLRGNYADSFAEFDLAAAGQIASVAAGAD